MKSFLILLFSCLTILLTACSGGESSSNVSAPTVSITISDNAIVQIGSNAIITWASTNANTCSLSGAWNANNQNSSGSQTVSQNTMGYYTYNVTCNGPGGSTTQSSVLTVSGTTPYTCLTTIGNNNQAIYSNDHVWYEAGLTVPYPNQIVAITTTLTVPPSPQIPTQPSSASLSAWSGLGPIRANYGAIGNGVLQPVINFYIPYENWNVSSTYDNSNIAVNLGYPALIQGYNLGQSGGASGIRYVGDQRFPPANTGDVMTQSMSLNPINGYWTVTHTNKSSNLTTTLVVNMSDGNGNRQAQNWAQFALEVYYNLGLNSPIIFTNTQITFAQPDTNGSICSANAQGPINHYVMTPPTLDSTKTICQIATIVIRRPSANVTCPQ